MKRGAAAVSGQGSIPAVRVLAGRAAAACALVLLTACAGGNGGAELKTASDQTVAEKRASIRLQLAVGYYQQGKYDIALDEI